MSLSFMRSWADSQILGEKKQTKKKLKKNPQDIL